MKLKSNQTLFDRTYSNLTFFFFFDKNKFKSFNDFMTKVNSNCGNETKSDIFSWIIFKSDINFHRSLDTKIFQ